MIPKTFLTFNAGSSTIKIGVYSLSNGNIAQTGFAKVDLNHSPVAMEVHRQDQTVQVLLKHSAKEDLHDIVDELLRFLETHLLFDYLTAVGHRVVHGGDLFVDPIILNKPEMDTLEQFIPFAPLHQAQALLIAKAVAHLRPNLIQTASFDTAFHQTQSSLIRHYAIPESLFNAGIKRFGFHGLSYQFIQSQLAKSFKPWAHGKVVVAHLGSGASLCAMNEGQSQDCSMGFSTLSGIPMSTRCGDLDPGILLYLQKEKGCSYEQLEHLLYKESGLLGVSGISGDTRDLLASDDPSALLALELFSLRIAGEVGRMATTLNGLNTLVFTGGVGEHQAQIRSMVCNRLSWLGVDLDESLNHSKNGQEGVISTPKSAVSTLVIPTNEEAVIAKDLVKLLNI